MIASKKKRKKLPLRTRFRNTLRARLLSGVLVVVPLGITVVILRFLYGFTAGRLTPLVKDFSGPLPDYAVPAVSIVLLLALLYVLGVTASFLVGRRLISLFEWVLRRIPLVKTVYGASKQVVEALSFQDSGTNFKSVVFVDFPRPGMRALAFVTGAIELEDAATGTVVEHCKVFIPTTPNPTSGYFEIVPQDAISPSGLTVEEAVTFVMSGGLVSPESLAALDASRQDGRDAVSRE